MAGVTLEGDATRVGVRRGERRELAVKAGVDEEHDGVDRLHYVRDRAKLLGI